MRIPTGNFGNVTPSPQPTRIDVSNTGAQANAMQYLATVGIGVAEDQQRRIDQENQEIIQSKTLKLDEFLNDQLNNPDYGLMSLQGANAEGATQKYTERYETFANGIAADLSPEMRQELQKQAVARRVQFQRAGFTHEISQRRQLETGTYNARLESSLNRAATYGNDLISFQLETGSTRDTIGSFGAAHGWSAEMISAAQGDYQRKAEYMSMYNAASTNPGAFSSRSGGSLSDLRQAVFMQESGGKHFDDQGQPVTSPKGAVGIAQVMPTTAPEAAALAGLPWDENRYRNDPEYNRALGEAYLDKQLADFGGNRTLALAAYNAGAGSVNKWIKDFGDPRSGVISESEFAEKIPYSETRNYVQSVLTRTGGATSPYPQFANLSPVEQARLRHYADSLLSRQQAEYRDFLDGQVRDATAAALRGKVSPDVPDKDQFVNAYGIGQGLGRYEDFKKTLELGNDISLIQKMPYAAQVAYMRELEPSPGSGYANDAQRYDRLMQAFTHVNQARRADPVQYAIEQEQANALDLSTPEQVKTGLLQRTRQAVEVSHSYGTQLTVFSKTEASQIGEMLRTAPASQSVAYLDAMRQGLGTGAQYSAALQQVSSYAPSAAVAGAIMGKGGSIAGNSGWISDTMVNPDYAAKTIMEGANARAGVTTKVNGVENKTKGIEMPKDTDLRPDFDSKVGDAFAGDAIGAAQAYEVAKDYYAGLMTRKGTFSGEYDSDAWEQAINVATGGVYDYNGQGNVLLPWGMSESQFDSSVNMAWKEQIVDAGIKAPPGQYGLQSFGDSQYLIKLGAGYLTGKDGNPVVLRLNSERVRLGKGGIPE
ncbi:MULTISPECIES: lytic transglycosylase domain-containing protein [unclassified Serratia (in: enterobacteria)]|uniref:lytic transglycosylase domain-containing protein n=1 Tax=unclassified Serratia (in: enterobacteria) TaxID=2647522 RepID=UPI0030760AA0